MAGGLGTRMRSAVPKHFHPILGRRMVDWVIGARREPVPTRSSSSRRRPARDAFDGRRHGRRAGGAARHRRRGARRAARARRARRRRARALRRHAAAHARAARRPARDPSGGAARPRRSSAPSPPTPRSTAASSAAPTARCSRIVEGTRCDRGGARDRRDQLLDLRLPRRCALAGARAARSRRTSRASSISPT